ncbi:MAG: Fe(3+) dicitrate transport protein FecA [Candidatus Moanabacter tarae]|uniref:Fe(3+) dicitrate transport protein FecA n=1 Tax=Candidatus Moanibacter tarae TaxID=2200854 RepID=A0A2Z4AHA5_9BACT|nr:MAG: Fe(3+) dicitrate transport protein FecA [Candidatus Moanabacter tarae]|tara:strand:- start:4826 stop:7159 length:2334 start_codon:yes stop_codon:yes gene_type:complete
MYSFLSELKRSFLIAAIAILQLTALGEEGKESSIGILKEFDVIGSAESAYQLPGSGTYLRLEKIEALQLDDINLILRTVPGVYLREEDGYGLFPNISLRGVDTTRNAKITVMEDGVPTAPATYSAPSAYYSPTAGRMSGIEVLKGSSQINWGPHTTGGVINYLSTPIPVEGRRGLLRQSYGSNNEIRAEAQFGEVLEGNSGNFGYLVEVFHRQNDGFKTIDGAGNFPGSSETGFERTDYMFKANWNPNSQDHQYIEFKIGYSELHSDETYLGLASKDFKDNPFRRYAATRNDRIDTHHTRLHLRHLLHLGERGKLITTAYYQNFHRNWNKLHDIRDIDTDGNGTPEGDEPDGSRVGEKMSRALAGGKSGMALEVLRGSRAGKLRVRANNRRYYMAGVQTNFDYTLISGDTTHNIDAGLRFHRDRIRRFQWHNLFVQDSSGSWEKGIRSVNGSDGNRRQLTEAFSAYFSDEIRGNSWSVKPGIRLENLSFEYDDFTTDGTNVPFRSGSSDLTVIAPGFGGTFQPKDGLMVFGGYHRGISTPSPRNHTKSGIKEETSNAFELGTRFNDQKGFYGEVVFFHTVFNDLIVVDNIGGAGTGSSENVGTVDSTGLEVAFVYDQGVVNEWNFKNPYSISLTYTNATLEGDANSEDEESIFAGGTDGSYVPYIPKWQLNLSAGIETAKWRTYVNAYFTSSTFTSATNTDVEINPNTGNGDARFGKTDSRFMVDVSAYYRIGKEDDFEIFGTITNLFDREYISSRHPKGPRPGAPRLASVGVQYKF